MKALVKYDQGPGNVGIRDVPEPFASEGLLKIKVILSGICGSDLHILQSDIGSPVRTSVVMGHEYVGTVSEVGIGVEGFSVGDRVVSETSYASCSVCNYCRTGQINLCNNRRTIGYWYNGSFTDYLVVPAKIAYKVPDNVSDVVAAMCEPLACVCHAIYDLSRIAAGDVVLINGPGSIGLMALLVAKAHGACVVVCGVSTDSYRLDLAKKLGADYTVNVETQNVNEILKVLTRGYGVDVVLECSGSEKGIDVALQSVRKQGYYTQIGFTGKKIMFDIEKICYKELNFTGSVGSNNRNWCKAIKLLQDEIINIEPLADSKFEFSDWRIAFDSFANKKGCKCMLYPPSHQNNVK